MNLYENKITDCVSTLQWNNMNPRSQKKLLLQVNKVSYTFIITNLHI